MVAIMNALLAAAAAHYGPSGSSSSMGSKSMSSMGDYPSYGSMSIPTSCSLDGFVPQFPSGQNMLVAPTQPARFIGLAFGVQNYTCSTANNYTAAGAVAELIDVSCLVHDPGFSTIQNDLYNVWTNLVSYPIQIIIDFLHLLDPLEVLCQHYFVPNPTMGQGLSPKWDFTSSGAFEGNADAFIVAKGKGSIPAPTNATRDVAWLDVVNVQGKIADEVFRFDTVGGQPPATCQYGKDKDLSVKYVSKYIFYGGSAMPTKKSSSTYSSWSSSSTKYSGY